MTLYTFHMCDADGFSACFEAHEAPYDSAAYPVAGRLLDAHASADHVAVWDGERPVFRRDRKAPGIAPTCAPAPTAPPA